MTGVIVDIHFARELVAVRTDKGHSIFALLPSSAEMEVGDEVSWQYPTSLGATTIQNITQNTSSEVYFQNHHVPADKINKNLRRP